MKARAEKATGFVILVLLGTLVYLLWNESWAWYRWIQGLIISTLAFGLTNRFLLKHPYQSLFAITPVRLIRYLAVLTVAIFRSGFHAIWITLRGRINVGVVDLPTSIDNPFYAALVASAITLTPGTVTVDYRPGSFKVIWIERTTETASEAGKLIKEDFESIFITDNDTEER